MGTFIRLPLTCTVKSVASSTKNLAGQKIITYTSGTDIRCLFIDLATDNKVSPVVEDEDIVEILIDDQIIPKYSDQIVSIRNRFGDVLDAGPFEIIGIRKYVGYVGARHHYRLRTRRLRKQC